MLAAIARAFPASSAVVTDPGGRVLLVQSFNRAYWGCPGGVVDPGESPERAAERELAEEAGLHLAARRLLLVSWIAGRGEDLEHMPGVQFFFDMGTVAAEPPLRLQPDEIRAADWIAPDRLTAYMGPLRAERIHAALDARTSGPVRVLSSSRAEVDADAERFTAIQRTAR
jgi:8-oxo-dGTP pyrophosphatase MutT (NUDIX family)